MKIYGSLYINNINLCRKWKLLNTTTRTNTFKQWLCMYKKASGKKCCPTLKHNVMVNN